MLPGIITGFGSSYARSSLRTQLTERPYRDANNFIVSRLHINDFQRDRRRREGLRVLTKLRLQDLQR